jgi:hypothetical protein
VWILNFEKFSKYESVQCNKVLRLKIATPEVSGKLNIEERKRLFHKAIRIQMEDTMNQQDPCTKLQELLYCKSSVYWYESTV